MDNGIGAAIDGVAVIAALAAHNSAQQSQDVPSWAVGEFTGYDDFARTDVRMSIYPGGNVSGYAGRDPFEGRFQGSRLETSRYTFRIERSGNGFSRHRRARRGASRSLSSQRRLLSRLARHRRIAHDRCTASTVAARCLHLRRRHRVFRAGRRASARAAGARDDVRLRRSGRAAAGAARRRTRVSRSHGRYACDDSQARRAPRRRRDQRAGRHARRGRCARRPQHRRRDTSRRRHGRARRVSRDIVVEHHSRSRQPPVRRHRLGALGGRSASAGRQLQFAHGSRRNLRHREPRRGCAAQSPRGPRSGRNEDRHLRRHAAGAAGGAAISPGYAAIRAAIRRD